LKKKALRLFISLLLPLLAGGVAGFFTAGGIGDWYHGLQAPSFNPPDWIFGPVWTTLYLVMGYSFYRIWMKPPTGERLKSMRIYFLQLALNLSWSFLFFSFHEIGLAMADIVLLWGSILWMIVLFKRTDALAGYLNIPYLLWVSFASVLNGTYLFLN